MFLFLLNDIQKTSFLSICKQFINSDKIVDLNEAELFGILKQEMGFAPDLPTPDTDLDQCLAAMNTAKSKAIVLMELDSGKNWLNAANFGARALI